MNKWKDEEKTHQLQMKKQQLLVGFLRLFMPTNFFSFFLSKSEICIAKSKIRRIIYKTFRDIQISHRALYSNSTVLKINDAVFATVSQEKTKQNHE